MNSYYNTVRIIEEPIIGIVRVREDCQYNKIEAEKVIVEAHVTARLFGRVKDIEVKKGGKLYLHGVVYGRIQNEGEIVLFA